LPQRNFDATGRLVESAMKNFLVAASIFVAVTYALDTQMYHGRYYSGLTNMTATIYQHFR
jgi:hypothetical protein